MNEYVVFTPNGDYHIFAKSREQAKDAVFKLTFGRVSKDLMTVEVKK